MRRLVNKKLFRNFVYVRVWIKLQIQLNVWCAEKEKKKKETVEINALHTNRRTMNSFELLREQFFFRVNTFKY